jgi:hypothetical protein
MECELPASNRSTGARNLPSKIVQNKPRSGIGAGDPNLRDLRADSCDNLHLRKRLTSLFCAVSGEIRPDRCQLAGPLSEKSQKQLLLATQNSES